MPKSINFVVLGKQDAASGFGKKGTESDLTLYDRKESDVIKTWVIPNGFPDKIQPLFQAINLAEHVVFLVDKLDRFTGEQIIALDSLRKKKGIISHTFDVDESRLEAMIKGTAVEDYIRVEQDGIKEEMDRILPVTDDGDVPELLVDHCFDVKGVGTVILGKVTGGTIRQYDNLVLYPSDTDILIKSIQMHDDPVTESSNPARVGLAVKGVKPDEISRGDIITQRGAVDVKTAVNLDFQKSPFYKGDIAENQGCLANIGLQTRAARISSVSPLVLEFEKPIACKRGQIAVILKPESERVRIMGSGSIT